MAHWEAKRSELDKIDRIDRGCGTWTADGGHVQLPLCPRIPRSSDVIQDERYVYGVVFEALVVSCINMGSLAVQVYLYYHEPRQYEA